MNTMSSVASAGPRDRSMAAILLLAAVTLIGVLAMLPSTEEKVAILMAENHYDQAIDLLEDRSQRTQLTSYEVFTLTRLYEISGRHADAARLLEADVAMRPQDGVWANRELVELYRTMGDIVGEAQVLSTVFHNEPSRSDLRRLLGLYRMNGDYGAERDLLIKAAGLGLASPSDMERLGRLSADEAAMSSAAVWVAPTHEMSALVPDSASLPSDSE
jgi:tetratricopeptide (TPR) repeat protein